MMFDLSFVSFAKRCGVKLTRGQRVLASVAFDGVEPRDLEGEDRELARRIFGDIETVPHAARATCVAVCGARAGKSYVICALRLLHLALTVPLPTLAPGEVAPGIIVAPDLRLARQTLRFALGAARSVPAIASLIEAESSDSFSLTRPDGKRVVIECLPATRGGSALRGRTTLGAVLDEAAFFRDESSVVNDLEIYKALSPRIVAGGQIVIASTPWSEAGLLHSMFTANHGAPVDAIAAHAPTTLLRDDPRIVAMIERERARDPENAAREFDARFMVAGSGLFFDSMAIDRAVGELGAPVLRQAAGIDLGFVSDSSAIVVVGATEERIGVSNTLELRPEKGRPLVPSEVVGAFAALAKCHDCHQLMADAHYLEAARETAMKHGVSLASAPGGQEGKAQTYLYVRELLNAGKLVLPNNARLLAQLKAIVAKPMPGGGLAISSPRRAGAGHGDLVSAFVLAVWGMKNASAWDLMAKAMQNVEEAGGIAAMLGGGHTHYR